MQMDLLNWIDTRDIIQMDAPTEEMGVRRR